MSPDPTTAQFVQLSALLTGFNASVIAPTIDPVNLPATFIPLIKARTGAAFDALLAAFARLAGGMTVDRMTPAQRQAIGEALLGLNGQPQDPQVSATAQAIMKLWYLGSWYQPFDFTAPDGQTFTTDLIFGFVVSNQAYVKGLAWQVMQSHAMGNSTWTFGYWAKQPPDLSAFTGNPAPLSAAAP